MSIAQLRNTLPSHCEGTSTTESVSELETPDTSSYASLMSPVGSHCMPLPSPAFAPHPLIMTQGGMMINSSMLQTPYDVLAREFGVQPDLVHAVAQRLVMGTSMAPAPYH